MGGYALGSPVLVRVAGLPASVLRDLRSDDLAAQLDEIMAGERRLAADGERISAGLHQVIGALAEAQLRTRLLAVRRAVFQVRRPARGCWTAEVARGVPAELAGQIDGWLTRHAAWQQQCERLPELLAAHDRSSEPVLRQHVADPAFGRALQLATPTLAGERARWISPGGHRPRRQKLLRLAGYLARAAAKTSPFSAFAVTSAADWQAAGAAVAWRDADPCMVVELNQVLVDAVVERVAMAAAAASRIPVRITPTLVQDGGRLAFLGPRPAERLVAVPATPALLCCLAAVRTDPECTMGRLRELTAGRSQSPGRLADRLLAIGLLEPRLEQLDDHGDPVRGVLAWLDGNPGTVGAGLHQALARASSAVRRAGGSPAGSGLAQAAEATRALAAAVGLDAGPGEPARGPATRWLHDNAVTAPGLAACAGDAWRPVLDDLDVLRRLLAVHDPLLPFRLSVAGYFRQRFGRGAAVPFLTFHEAVHREIAAETPAGRELHALASLRGAGAAAAGQGRLREASALAAESRRALNGPPGQPVVRHDPAAVTARIAGWPSWLTAEHAVAFYVQPLDPAGPAGLRVAFNAASVGYGRGRSRWSGLLDRAGLDGAAPHQTACGPGGNGPAGNGLARYAEFRAPFGSALNVRPPAVPYELDYPWSAAIAADARRIPVGELTVQEDPGPGLLQLRTPGDPGPVRPRHTGLMADVLLPPAASLLRMAFGGMCGISSGFLMEQGRSSAGGRTPGEPARHPRIELGRVVVQRARWTIRAAGVPLQQPGEADSAHLIRFRRWLDQAGIPDHCFVRTRTAAGRRRSASAASPDWVFDRSAKPVFVDAASWYLVQAWQRTITDPDDLLIFEEALPDPLGNEPPGGRVSEFLLEISETARD